MATLIHNNQIFQVIESAEEYLVGLDPVSYTHLTLPTKA